MIKTSSNQKQSNFKLYSVSCSSSTKQLNANFSYKTLDEFGDVLHTTESSPLNVLIESNKFPKSPFKAGNYQPGQPVEFVIEFEKYPDPRPENVVWVVKDDDDKTQEFKPGNLQYLSSNRWVLTLNKSNFKFRY